MGFRYVREYTHDRYPIVTQLRRASVSRHLGLFRRFEEDRLAFGVFRLSEATDSDGVYPVPRLFRALAGYERACGHSSVVTDAAKFFLCGFSVYYFVALIIQYYVLSPVLIGLNKLRGGVFLTAVISAVSIMAVTCMMSFRGYNLPLLVYAGGFPLWIIFFFMGIRFQIIRGRSI